MSLFLNLLTIVDIRRDEELSFIQPSSKYKYTAKKLEYYHECFNNIWYYLNHKSATGLNDTKDSISTLYRDDFTETYKKIEGNNVSWQDFNSQLLVNLGNKFYEEIIPELHNSILEITSNITDYLYKNDNYSYSNFDFWNDNSAYNFNYKSIYFLYFIEIMRYNDTLGIDLFNSLSH
jgi:hypothetical protein